MGKVALSSYSGRNFVKHGGYRAPFRAIAIHDLLWQTGLREVSDISEKVGKITVSKLGQPKISILPRYFNYLICLVVYQHALEKGVDIFVVGKSILSTCKEVFVPGHIKDAEEHPERHPALNALLQVGTIVAVTRSQPRSIS